jgi:hypothetical protein
MPPSADESGQRLALTAECLFLANLTLAPVVAFLLLLVLYYRQNTETPALARCHLRQAMAGSLWAGVLLVLLNCVILLLGGYHSTYTLIALILYFITCHSVFILLGMAGIAKALSGQPFVYPLIGRRCDD